MYMVSFHHVRKARAVFNPVRQMGEQDSVVRWLRITCDIYVYSLRHVYILTPLNSKLRVLMA